MMVGPTIAPVVPNIGGQEEAIAGSSAMIFTATDRKIIEERTGEVDRNRRFLEAFKGKPLTPEVENEETSVKPHQNVAELADRIQEHRQILKHSTLSDPKERVEISNRPPDTYEEEKKPELKTEVQNLSPQEDTGKKVLKKTAAIAKELKLDPSDILSKFTLEQEELHALISHIKELHLKRLFTEQEKEFEKLTENIKKKTLAAAKAEAKAWLEAQLDKLTRDAAEYKLGLLKSLQAMDFNAQREKIMQWLISQLV